MIPISATLMARRSFFLFISRPSNSTDDALDRITGASNGTTTDGWTYDADGNRTAQTGTTASTFNVAATSNQLNSISGALTRSYSYNAAGMTTAYGGNTFTYNNRGRMLGVSTTAGTTGYLYNALGQLIEKAASSPTGLFVYDLIRLCSTQMARQSGSVIESG